MKQSRNRLIFPLFLQKWIHVKCIACMCGYTPPIFWILMWEHSSVTYPRNRRYWRCLQIWGDEYALEKSGREDARICISIERWAISCRDEEGDDGMSGRYERCLWEGWSSNARISRKDGPSIDGCASLHICRYLRPSPICWMCDTTPVGMWSVKNSPMKSYSHNIFRVLVHCTSNR